jgi:hypothetical protein
MRGGVNCLQGSWLGANSRAALQVYWGVFGFFFNIRANPRQKGN